MLNFKKIVPSYNTGNKHDKDFTACKLQFYLPLTKTFKCEGIIRFTVPKPLSATFPIQSTVLYSAFNTGDGKGF